MGEHDDLKLDPKYSEEEVAFAMTQLAGSKGGIHGFEFNTFNVTQELEDIRREKWLEKAGFKSGTVQELLNLSDDDMSTIEIRLVNARLWKGLRKALDEKEELEDKNRVLEKTLKEIETRCVEMMSRLP